MRTRTFVVLFMVWLVRRGVDVGTVRHTARGMRALLDAVPHTPPACGLPHHGSWFSHSVAASLPTTTTCQRHPFCLPPASCSLPSHMLPCVSQPTHFPMPLPASFLQHYPASHHWLNGLGHLPVWDISPFTHHTPFTTPSSPPRCIFHYHPACPTPLPLTVLQLLPAFFTCLLLWRFLPAC